jgi:hypothetical protein
MRCEACEGSSRPEDQTGHSGPGLEMLRRWVQSQSESDQTDEEVDKGGISVLEAPAEV